MYGSFFEEAPIPIFCTDRDGTILYANARMVSILQKIENELHNSHIQSHIAEEHHQMITTMLDDPTLHPQARLNFCGTSENIVALDVSISKREQDIIWFCEDNRKEEQLQREKKQFQTLPKEYGHSINNLLTVILSATQLIEMDIDEGSEIYADIQDISEAALRAAAQTRLFMQLGRQDRMQHIPILLDDIYTKYTSLLQMQWGESNIDWQKGLSIFGNEYIVIIAISMSWMHLNQKSPHSKWALSLQKVELSHRIGIQCCGINGGTYACLSFYDLLFENFLSMQTQDMFITQEESPLLAPVWDSIIRLNGSILQRKTQHGYRAISLFIPLL